MAGIDKLPSGKYRCRWVDSVGVRKSETFDTQREARQFLSTKLQAVDEQKKATKSGAEPLKTFRDLCNDWILHKLPLKSEAKTDTSIINKHFLPFFAKDKDVPGEPDITLWQLHNKLEDKVNQYIVLKKKEGLADNSVNNHVTILRAMFNYAFRVKKWLKSPTTLARVDVAPLEFHYLKTTEEIQRFLKACKEVGDLLYYLCSFALLTGMRLGEIVSLRWNNVSFDRRIILIRESHGESTKSGKERTVPINDQLLPLLNQWKEVCLNRKNNFDLVFPNHRGNMIDKNARIFKDEFNKALDKGNFPKITTRSTSSRYITFHNLRATFATHFMINGGNIFTLQKLLGHYSLHETEIYAKFAKQMFEGEMSRFNNLDSVFVSIENSKAETVKESVVDPLEYDLRFSG